MSYPLLLSRSLTKLWYQIRTYPKTISVKLKNLQRNSLGNNERQRFSQTFQTKENVQLPSIKKDITQEGIIDPAPAKLKKELLELNTSRKGSLKRDRISSINVSPRNPTQRHNFSTLEPSSYTKRKELLSEDDLAGITEKNEWDEIWKYAKLKEQEENSLLQHK